MLLGAGSEPRSGKEKMSVLRVEGTLLEGRDGTVLFCVRGTWGGESVCKGTDKTRFVPVSIHRTPTLLKTTKRWAQQ